MPPRDAHPDQPLLGAICQMCQRALSSPRTKTSKPSAAVLHPPRVCIEAGTQSANQHATCRRFRWGRSPLRGGSIPAPAAQNPLAAESSASCTDRTNRTSPLSARSSVPNGTSATRRARLNHGGSRASARNAVASRSARTSLRASSGVASHDLRSYPFGIRPLDLPSILPEPCGTPIDDLEEVGVRIRMVLGLRSEV